MIDVLKKIEAIKPFSESDAWMVYKIVAITEAVGWTILIIGVGINRYHLPGQEFSVKIAGQIHGTFFLVYFGAVLAVYTSLGWSRRKFIVALIAGVPPYGSLVFEQWASWMRKNDQTLGFTASILAYLAQISGSRTNS